MQMNIKVKYFYAFLREHHHLLRFRRNTIKALSMRQPPINLSQYFKLCSASDYIMEAFTWCYTKESINTWHFLNIKWKEYYKWLKFIGITK